jgi:hypothetical protein
VRVLLVASANGKIEVAGRSFSWKANFNEFTVSTRTWYGKKVLKVRYSAFTIRNLNPYESKVFYEFLPNNRFVPKFVLLLRIRLFFYRDRLEALARLIRPPRRKPKCDRTATERDWTWLAPRDATGHLNANWTFELPPVATGRDWMPLDNDKS